MDEKAAKIETMAKEIEAENRKRRARAKRTPSRPSSYRYAELEERTTVMMPEGVVAGKCDIIGKDISRILHREPAKVWVEIIERPVLRMKADKDSPNRAYTRPRRLMRSSVATTSAPTCSRR